MSTQFLVMSSLFKLLKKTLDLTWMLLSIFLQLLHSKKWVLDQGHVF